MELVVADNSFLEFDEILQKIFSFLNLSSFAAVKLVSKRWLDLATRKTTLAGRNDWQLVQNAEISDNGEIILTPNCRMITGAVICKALIDSCSEIRISFQLYAGDGKTFHPGWKNLRWCGDGTCFFIVDGSKHDGESIGQFGSALGYASLSRLPGIPYGILGIGFDEWGNFTRSCEGKDGVKAREGQTSWSVCLRGPVPGCRYIAHKQIPEWYSTWVTVDIFIRVQSDVGFITVKMAHKSMEKTEIFGNIPIPGVFPKKIAIGFSSSTGAATNKHAIRDVSIVEKFYGEEITTVMGDHTFYHK